MSPLIFNSIWIIVTYIDNSVHDLSIAMTARVGYSLNGLIW